jgi:hypothetical protein
MPMNSPTVKAEFVAMGFYKSWQLLPDGEKVSLILATIYRRQHKRMMPGNGLLGL